jgi:predicted Rossmann fold flavoprotein
MKVETLILGAGAAGMMCAAYAGRDVLVVDHAKAPGEKIRISGGGRCNFTNMYTEPANFLSENPHFCKSALSRYTQWDFMDLVGRHGIAWHEKTLGQLFCDEKSTQIVQMLRAEMGAAQLMLRTSVKGVRHGDGAFYVDLEREGKAMRVVARNLVLATGGKSIPKMGATGIAYDIAQQFSHEIVATRPALVPLTFTGATLDALKPLAGVACPAVVSGGGAAFEEALLFTHRGLSGPAILQVSSYWEEGAEIAINMLPGGSVLETLKSARQTQGRKALGTVLAGILPKALAASIAGQEPRHMADFPDTDLIQIAERISNWKLVPAGTEGYRTAEVTAGGVSTKNVSSKTMESAYQKGLYIIGEAIDVTGWLGGYNFQWAWSSAVAAGRAISGRPS